VIYSDWVKHKQAEVLAWQILKIGNDDDGGFVAERPNDPAGVWTTSEALYTLLEHKVLPLNDERIQKAKNWLLRHRNLGGDYGDGWPLINRGNSFVDTTAMAILALSFFHKDQEVLSALTKAKDWLLENQNEDDGWGIWKYEDSLISATSYALLALEEANSLFKEEKPALAIEAGANWLRLAQNPDNHLWGFAANAQETNNASTCQALIALFLLGDDPKNYKTALDSLLSELKTEGTWRSVHENYTLKYFGEGLDQRLSWFTAPKVVWVLVSFAWNLDGEVDIKQIVEAAESLRQFDANYQGREVTDISIGGGDYRPWASAEYLRGLLEAQTYLQEHLGEYVSVMSKKITVLEKAGLLQSAPIVMPFRKQTSVYASGKFFLILFPLLTLSMMGIAYLTEITDIEITLVSILFSIYMLTFLTLLVGFRQKVVSRNKFCFMYFPIWALIVVATILLYIGETTEGLVVALLIGFPEILSLVMNKTKREGHEGASE
jgi:hypothetical protein